MVFFLMNHTGWKKLLASSEINLIWLNSLETINNNIWVFYFDQYNEGEIVGHMVFIVGHTVDKYDSLKLRFVTPITITITCTWDSLFNWKFQFELINNLHVELHVSFYYPFQ